MYMWISRVCVCVCVCVVIGVNEANCTGEGMLWQNPAEGSFNNPNKPNNPDSPDSPRDNITPLITRITHNANP